jgi:hypothetical protein
MLNEEKRYEYNFFVLWNEYPNIEIKTPGRIQKVNWGSGLNQLGF